MHSTSEPGVVVISAGDPFSTLISVRSHSWKSDEPAGSGGRDTGPTPFELFLGSIAACSAITVRMYAARKGWPLTSVSIEIGHRKVEAAATRDRGPVRGPVTEIRTVVRFEGELSEDQRQRLLEIAGRCPVKRTVEGEVRFHAVLG